MIKITFFEAFPFMHYVFPLITGLSSTITQLLSHVGYLQIIRKEFNGIAIQVSPQQKQVRCGF